MTEFRGVTSRDDDDLVTATADAVESLVETDAAIGFPTQSLIIAAAIFAEFGENRNQLLSFAGRLRAITANTIGEAVPPAGVCTTGCPPDDPAAYREYDDDGATVYVCDHVPIHKRP